MSETKRVAVGFFDGVHLGHQAVLKTADVALTFQSHPLALLRPERAPRLIMSLDDRLAAIRACGVSEVVALPFTCDLAAVAPADFAARFLGAPPRTVLCGGNWRFGCGGRGDAAFLRTAGYGVEVAPYVLHQGAPISSTRIRAALEVGEIGEANQMMGRVFRTLGTRFAGKGAGRKIGFPTVNLRLSALDVKLPRGVYVVTVDDAWGLANFGVAPTFGSAAWPEPVLEIHFLSVLPASAEAPQAHVSFHRFVRPERSFASVEALKAQIAADLSSVSHCAAFRQAMPEACQAFRPR